MTLADIHNRRKTIELVAAKAQQHNYPLLTWPEDKELLRLSDLPIIQNGKPNFPSTWTNIRVVGEYGISNDNELRAMIRIGQAYYRSAVRRSLTFIVAITADT